MRFPVRSLLALPAALLVLAAPAGAVAAPVPLAGSLRLCVPAKDSTGGSAVFRGSMPLVPGANRMEMRFDLQQVTVASDAFAKLAVPKWGEWQRSEPGRSGFVYRKKLVGLVGPAAYRAQIRFRWLDASDKVVRAAKRVTGQCRQPDLRPNLTVGNVTAQPLADDPSSATYRVVVRNAGRGPAGAFAVSLGSGGVVPARGQVEALARGSRSVVEIVGPACAVGGTIDVAVDPENLVAESDESDDTRSVACALPG